MKAYPVLLLVAFLWGCAVSVHQPNSYDRAIDFTQWWVAS